MVSVINPWTMPLVLSGLQAAGQFGLSAYSNWRDRKMWRMQNEYNSPEAQMRRLKKAGLNPHLVYGNAQIVGNSVGSRPSTQTPQIDIGNILNYLSQSQEIAYKKAQTQYAEQKERESIANERLIIERIPTEWTKQDVQFREASKKNVETGILQGMYPLQHDKLQMELNEIMPLIVKKYGSQAADLAWKVAEQNPANIELIYETIRNIESRTGLNAQTFEASENLGGYNQGAVMAFITALLKMIVTK